MKLVTVVLFFGFCGSHWTAAAPGEQGDYLCIVDDKGILMGIAAAASVNHINLSFENIKYIAKKAFNNLPNVTTLDLSNNGLTRLPPLMFSKLNNLEELSLANNKISFIDRPFFGLNKLKRLDLSNNARPDLRRGALFGLTNSLEIITKGSGIESLSSSVFQDPAPQHEKFDLPPIKNEEIYPSFEELVSNESLPKVKICKTDDGRMISVEQLKPNKALGNCIKVTLNNRQLALNDLGLKKFQRGWYKLPAELIHDLDLSRNLINVITPELLNDLPSGLSTIHLSNNNIEIIRRNVIENKFIKGLFLRDNSLSEIEDMAFEKTNLTFLSVGSRALTNLAFVRALPKTIESFYLVSSSITKIPVDTFRGFKNLKNIGVYNALVEEIEPGTFDDQKQLVTLKLEHNKIRELDPGIFKDLKMVKEISFWGNKLKKISRDTFSELRNLSDLIIDLEKNQINIIEEGSFSNMNIKMLHLGNNRISDESIAKGAFNTCALRYLSFDWNLMTKINGDIFEGILSSDVLTFRRNQIKTIEKGAAKYMNNVHYLELAYNPLERLENGALYGLSKDKDVEISLKGSPIKLIQGGLFDDV